MESSMENKMTVTDLWNQYDNLKHEADHLQELIYEMESDRARLLERAQEAIRAIEDMQGEIDWG